MAEIKVKLSQSRQNIGGVSIDQNGQGIGVNISSGGLSEVVHDDTLKGRGTIVNPLGVADEVLEDIDSRVEKTDIADKIYGTDSEGNQTFYDKDSFGQVDDVLVNDTSVVENKIANITIGDGTLTIQKNGNTVGTFTANQSGNTIVNIEADVQQQADWNEADTTAPDYIKNKPTKVSDFTNDADYQSGADVAASIATHNEDPEAHADIRAEIAELDEWTPTQYEATTTNFVVGNPYTVEEAFQRTASLFAGTQGEIETINGKIPAQASSSNQLADKNFVNSTVASNAANFRGNWETWADVPTNVNDYPVDYAGNKTPTNNDYLVVDDASGYNVQNDGAWRFIYVGDWATDGKSGWNPAYRIGHAFTADQQAAIDSGITATMVDDYVDPTSTASTAYNARITAVETDKRDIINSANKVYATDANGANKNDLVYDKTVTADTIAQRGTNGVLKVGTPVDNNDAATKQYVDAVSGDLDEHIADKNNPHEVTKAQVGLGNVDNTSDLNKPISTATQTALNAKQDTLTAGTNITIDVNNVISSTAQESFFRGKWNNWASVPTSSSFYPEDYHGSRVPTSNDFLVINDASDYQGSYDNRVDFSWKNEMMYGALNKTNITFIDATSGATSTLSRGDYRNEVRTQVGNIYVKLAGFGLTIYFYSDSGYSIPTQVEYNGNIVASITYDKVGERAFTIYYAHSDTTYEGAWRFSYIGDWDTNGKSGWKPQYQIENTLPVASDVVAGIAKLYTSTGNNTDGSIDQATITTQLSGKQETLVSGTNIKTINNNSLLGSGDITIDSLPSQTGQNGKFLTTDGTDASWGDVSQMTATYDSTTEKITFA